MADSESVDTEGDQNKDNEAGTEAAETCIAKSVPSTEGEIVKSPWGGAAAEVDDEDKTDTESGHDEDKPDTESGHDEDRTDTEPGHDFNQGNEEDTHTSSNSERGPDPAGFVWSADSSVNEIPQGEGGWDNSTSKHFNEKGEIEIKDGYCHPTEEVLWTAPLMEPVEPLKYNGFTIEREEYPFLTRFLNTSIADKPGRLTVGDVRMAACHRSKTWNSRWILHAVGLLIQLGDKTRLLELQLVLEFLYQGECRDQGVDISLEPVSDEQRSKAEMLLDVESYPCETGQRMLSQIQAILERCLYDYVKERAPQSLRDNNFDCPEQIELQNWHPRELPGRLLIDCLDPQDRYSMNIGLESAVDLRNMASHPQAWSRSHEYKANFAQRFLELTGDDESVARIKRLFEETEAHMQAAEQQRLDRYPTDAAGLLQLYTMTKNAGVDYAREIQAERNHLTSHERNVHRMYLTSAECFEDMYMQVKTAEENQADGDGDQTDEDGDQADEDGDQTDEDGDQAGEDGDQADEDEDHTNEDGDQTDEDGDQTDEDGNQADEDGDQSDENGDQTDEDGNQADEDGNQRHGNGDQTNEDGDRTVANGNQADEDNDKWGDLYS